MEPVSISECPGVELSVVKVAALFYAFGSLDQSVGWSEEFCFAIRLGSAPAPAPIGKIVMSTDDRAAHASQVEAGTE